MHPKFEAVFEFETGEAMANMFARLSNYTSNKFAACFWSYRETDISKQCNTFVQFHARLNSPTDSSSNSCSTAFDFLLPTDAGIFN